MVICIVLRRSPSVEITQGVFLSPKHSTEKFFRIFFKSTPSDFLLIFWREFVMRGRDACHLPMGGCPFLCGLVDLLRLFLFLALVPCPLLLRLFPCCLVLLCAFPFFPLSLWASVPYWMTASGHRGIGASGHPLTMGALRTGAKRLKTS